MADLLGAERQVAQIVVVVLAVTVVVIINEEDRAFSIKGLSIQSDTGLKHI
jgi:hypothetical protein